MAENITVNKDKHETSSDREYTSGTDDDTTDTDSSDSSSEGQHQHKRQRRNLKHQINEYRNRKLK